ncbi:UNVERIFIED_CONTAM: hypothetical protein RMT77_018667 [Armadillidium vulgare]
MNPKEVVDKYYYDVSFPHSYGGFSRFASQFPQVNKKDLKEYLAGEDAYTLHKYARKRFKSRKTEVYETDHTWQLDLTDMNKYSSYNNGNRYILFVIDVYSRYLWLKPLKDKKSPSVAKAVREIIDEDSRYPKFMWTDKGTEFLGKEFQAVVTEYDIGYYNTFSVNKAAIVERVQRTIKERMHRYFTKMNTFRYIDILKDLAFSYNQSYHRTIKKTPFEMLTTPPVINNNKYEIKDKTGIKEGDYVRVSRSSETFKKGYTANWSQEVFQVDKIKEFPRDGLKLYYLKDLDGEVVKGGFYKQEVQKISFDPKQFYKIEKVLGTKGKGKNKMFLIKWKGYPGKFNSYIKASELKKY